MRRLVRVLAIVVLVMSSLGFMGQTQAQALDLSSVTLQSSSVLAASERVNPADQLLGTEFGKKYDLNNTPLRKFRELRGFYPTLAGKIADYTKENPLKKVDDVLTIPGLSERQKEKLNANLDKFTVTPPTSIFNQEDNRYNPGVY